MCASDIDQIQLMDRASLLRWPRKYYTRTLTSSHYYAYLAQIENQYVGNVMYRIKNMTLYIDKILVTEPFQRQGVGGNLLEYAINMGKLQNVSQVILTVSAKNIEAIDFYFKHNFELERIKWNHYSSGDHGLKMCRLIQTVHMNS